MCQFLMISWSFGGGKSLWGGLQEVYKGEYLDSDDTGNGRGFSCFLIICLYNLLMFAEKYMAFPSLLSK